MVQTAEPPKKNKITRPPSANSGVHYTSTDKIKKKIWFWLVSVILWTISRKIIENKLELLEMRNHFKFYDKAIN